MFFCHWSITVKCAFITTILVRPRGRPSTPVSTPMDLPQHLLPSHRTDVESVGFPPSSTTRAALNERDFTEGQVVHDRTGEESSVMTRQNSASVRMRCKRQRRRNKTGDAVLPSATSTWVGFQLRSGVLYPEIIPVRLDSLKISKRGTFGNCGRKIFRGRILHCAARR